MQAFKKPSLEQYAEQVVHQQNCSDGEFPSLMGLHCATQLSRVPPSARQWTVQPQPPWTSLQLPKSARTGRPCSPSSRATDTAGTGPHSPRSSRLHRGRRWNIAPAVHRCPRRHPLRRRLPFQSNRWRRPSHHRRMRHRLLSHHHPRHRRALLHHHSRSAPQWRSRPRPCHVAFVSRLSCSIHHPIPEAWEDNADATNGALMRPLYRRDVYRGASSSFRGVQPVERARGVLV